MEEKKDLLIHFYADNQNLDSALNHITVKKETR